MELINVNLIEVDVHLNERDEVIHKFADILKQNDRINKKNEFLADVYHRENEVSTSMGLGVAIPHTQSEHVKESSLVFMKLSHPIQWNDDDNIEYIFGIAIPLKNKCEQHLKILSKLARKLMDHEFRENLSKIKTKEEGLSYLDFLNNEIK